MNFLLSTIVFLSGFFGFLDAKTIVPKGKGAVLKVSIPDLKNSKLDFEKLGISIGSKPEITFIPDVKWKPIELTPGVSHQIRAGKGCLEILYMNNFAFHRSLVKKCDIELKSNEETHIQLSAVHFLWDESVVNVDFGIVPSLVVSDELGNSIVSIDSLGKFRNSNLLFLPEGQYSTYFGDERSILEDTKSFVVKKDLEVLIKDVTPPNLLSEIEVVVEEVNEFTWSRKNNIFLALRKTPFPVELQGKKMRIPESYEILGYGLARNISSKDYVNIYAIDASEKTHKLKVLPLKDTFEGVYEIVSNESAQAFKILPGEKKRFEVATINIANLDSGRVANYKVFRQINDEFVEIFNYLDGIRLTPSSFNLIKGFNYRLDIYDNGLQVKEDVVFLDLTQ